MSKIVTFYNKIELYNHEHSRNRYREYNYQKVVNVLDLFFAIVIYSTYKLILIPLNKFSRFINKLNFKDE